MMIDDFGLWEKEIEGIDVPPPIYEQLVLDLRFDPDGM